MMATETPQHSLPTHARPPRYHRCPPLCADGARRNERSPWCRPFPPDSPPTTSRLRSNRSRVLVAYSDSSAPYTWAVRHVAFTHRPANSRAGQRFPGSRAESFLTCTGSTDRAGLCCRSRCRDNRCGLLLLSTGSAVHMVGCPQGRRPDLSISRLNGGQGGRNFSVPARRVPQLPQKGI